MNIEELLKKLESQIKYLSNNFKIPGMTNKDIAQELNLMIIEDFKKYSSDTYDKGWWFKRLKWHIQNKAMKESKEPVNRSIRIHTFGE